MQQAGGVACRGRRPYIRDVPGNAAVASLPRASSVGHNAAGYFRLRQKVWIRVQASVRTASEVA